jgi:hypothetical protein
MVLTFFKGKWCVGNVLVEMITGLRQMSLRMQEMGIILYQMCILGLCGGNSHCFWCKMNNLEIKFEANIP